jgi:hypothetical protein
MFSPTKSSLMRDVKNGHLTTWPSLTEQAINKHFKLMPATAMGHIDQRRHNIRSNSKDSITSEMEDETATPAGLGTKTHFVYAVVIDQGQLNTDLTGRFPVRSSNGNWYVMICYSYNCNYVKPGPMKSRSTSEWLKEYGGIHQDLKSRGFTPKLQTLDNEASLAFNFPPLKTMWNINSLC